MHGELRRVDAGGQARTGSSSPTRPASVADVAMGVLMTVRQLPAGRRSCAPGNDSRVLSADHSVPARASPRHPRPRPSARQFFAGAPGARCRLSRPRTVPYRYYPSLRANVMVAAPHGRAGPCILRRPGAGRTECAWTVRARLAGRRTVRRCATGRSWPPASTTTSRRFRPRSSRSTTPRAAAACVPASVKTRHAMAQCVNLLAWSAEQSRRGSRRCPRRRGAARGA